MTSAATYTLHASPDDAYVDGLVGARILTQDTTVNLSAVGLLPNGVNRNSSTTITNAIVGVKERGQISDSTWFVPFYLDVGAGSAQTNVTSQAMLGIGKTLFLGRRQPRGQKRLLPVKSEQTNSRSQSFRRRAGRDLPLLTIATRHANQA